MSDPGGPGPKGPARFHARVLELRTFGEAATEVARTSSEPEGVGIMTRKSRTLPIRLDGVSLKAAPLLKQELLAVGGDAAHARGIADHSVARSDVVLLATWGQYRRLIPKLERQPFGLSDIGRAIDVALSNRVRRIERPIKGVHHSFTVGGRTLLMGVVNVTPDSFSDGGKFFERDAAIAHAVRLGSEGADVIDLGGESTRPGAIAVHADEEWRRVGPVLSGLRSRTDRPISIDTRNAEVAERALSEGADLVNDVGGLRSAEMRRVISRSGAPVIVLHMRGDPATMQSNVEYGDLRGEVYGALADACATAEADGIGPGQLLIDPGLGFGKSPEQSLELLAHLSEFRSLGPPIVVGASRKSFLGWTMGGASLEDRGEAGIAAAVAAALGGADIVRVHEVLGTARALQLADRLKGAQTAEVD